MARAKVATRGLEREIDEYKRLRAADPGDERLAEHAAKAYLEKALREQEQGKPGRAAESFTSAAELWTEIGRLGRAARAWRALLAAQPGHPRATEALAALRRMRPVAAARDLGLAVASSLLLLAASPPFDLWPLALVGLVPLYLAIRRASPGRAFLLGWLSGFVMNFGGYFWGVGVLERFANLSAGTAIAAVAALAAYQAVVFALWAAGVAAARRWLRLDAAVSGPLLLAVLEAAVPFVFPWYLAICVWSAWPLTQAAELGGPPAVSALVVLVNIVFVGAGLALARRTRPGRNVVAGALVALAVVGLGLARAGHLAAIRRHASSLRVALVQPNFGITSMELRKHKGQQYIETLRRETEEAGARGAALVVWPESAFPFLFDRELEREFSQGHPWELRGRYAGRLLFGTLAHPFGESYINNSAVLVSRSGEIAGVYDKNRLLVFGEYVPLKDHFPAWAEGVRARLPDWPDIEPGRVPRVLVDGDLRLGPLICYEDILPEYVHRMARAGRPNLLVTLANHAWFGDSRAPHQALALATFRSIETRRDLVRATNTGVSSVGDALGRVRVRGALHDVPRDQPLSPEIFVADVRLVNAFALGPYTAPLFPFAAAAALAAAGLASWRRKAPLAIRHRTRRT